jgi:hypothetical protein
MRDIWIGFRHDGTLAPDERWGLRFALAWRFAVCCFVGACLVVRLLVRFHLLVVNPADDIAYLAPQEIWHAVLLCSMIAAVAGSRPIARSHWRRPWSWCLDVFGGFTAGLLFLMLSADHIIVPSLVHVSIAGILSAQPLRYASEFVAAGSSTRVCLFYDIASAGVVALLVSCILLWQLSRHWRSARWRRICLGGLLAASFVTMILLTARIALVEIPTISPIMAACIRVPTPLHLTGAIVLMVLLASAVARRWSEPSPAALGRAAWRRDEERYYHERLILLLPLGGIVLAQSILCKQAAYLWCRKYYSDWCAVGVFFEGPVACLSLALVMLTVQTAFRGWSKRSAVLATFQPRLTPALFLLTWLVLLIIIVCSAPILGSWCFAAFLRSGCYPSSW